MRRGRASLTARKVAYGLLYLDAHPQLARLLPEGAAATTTAILEALGVMPAWRQRIYRSGWIRRFTEWWERRWSPGLTAHMALRKRWVEDATVSALEAGARQVLEIGAGLDSLSARLAKRYPCVRFVEVDHPATQALKRRGLEGAGLLPENLELIPADLARVGLEQALEASRWDPSVMGAVVAEAVLMYLPAEAVSELLRTVTRLGPAGTRMIFTYMTRDAAGRPGGDHLDRFTRWSLAAVGEPLTWGIEPGGLAALLEEHGLGLVEAPDLEALRARYLEPEGLGALPLSAIERLAVAETRG